MTVLEDILDVNGLKWEITIWLLLLVEQRLYISPASLLRLNLCCIECTSSEGSVVFIFHFHPLIAITFFFILSCPLGKIKGKLIHFKMYVFRRTAEKGQQLSFGCNDYLFGNAVQITTNSRILSLCEVEVYSYSYGKNSILQHLLLHVKSQISLFHKFILQIFSLQLNLHQSCGVGSIGIILWNVSFRAKFFSKLDLNL